MALRKLLSLFIIVLLFLSGCATAGIMGACPKDDAEVACMYHRSGMFAFYKRIETDIWAVADLKIRLMTLLNNEIVPKRQTSRMSEAIGLRDDVSRIAYAYTYSKMLLDYREINAWSAVNNRYADFNRDTAEMTIEIGNAYAKLGDSDSAQKLYRGVITTYVGTAYRSQVKKAEFALEDLRDSRR